MDCTTYLNHYTSHPGINCSVCLHYWMEILLRLLMLKITADISALNASRIFFGVIVFFTYVLPMILIMKL